MRLLTLSLLFFLSCNALSSHDTEQGRLEPSDVLLSTNAEATISAERAKLPFPGKSCGSNTGKAYANYPASNPWLLSVNAATCSSICAMSPTCTSYYAIDGDKKCAISDLPMATYSWTFDSNNIFTFGDCATTAAVMPVYRYVSPALRHLYTQNPNEVGTVTAGQVGYGGWKSEGTGFFAWSGPRAGTVPLYRYYAPSTGEHFYTTLGEFPGGNVGQLNGAHVGGGIAFYLFPSIPSMAPSGCLVALYRYFAINFNGGDHFYSTNPTEIGPTTTGAVGANGYKVEGIVGYALANDSPTCIAI